MARIAFICSVIFILFAVTHGRAPLDVNTDVGKYDVSMIASESDEMDETLLPSENLAATMVELEAIVDLIEGDADESDKPDLELDHPVKVLTFNSDSRQFLHVDGERRSPFRFSHRHPCHHHQRKHGHEEHEHEHAHEREHDHEGYEHEHDHEHGHDHKGHEQEHEREHEHGHHHENEHGHDDEHEHSHSYGNDMILSDDNINADPMTHNDEEREHFHGHEGHERSYGNDMILATEDMDTNPIFHGDQDNDFHHHHHHHHHFHHQGRPWFPFTHEKDHDFHHHHHHMDHEEDEHMGSSLMKSFSKFLNHLF